MSNEIKLTPWYPASIKPVRKGMYQVRQHQEDPVWGRWDGKEWKRTSKYRRDAEVTKCGSIDMYVEHWKPEWRGVAK